MWQERQIELLKMELEDILSPLSDISGFAEIVKEPLAAAKRGLSNESIQDKPWSLLPSIVCEAISGDGERAVPITAVLQLLMASADVFDDIEDADSPLSLSSRYGRAIANNAATALIVLAETTITRLAKRGVADSLIVRIMNTVNAYNISMCMGQHLDLTLSLESGISEDMYLKMIAMKSASQTECACRVGALLATGNQELIDMFTSFGHNLGMAAQITNDIRGTIHGSDIEKKKPTLPLVYALTQTKLDTTTPSQNSAIRLSDSVYEPTQIKEMLFRTGAIHYALVKMQFYKQLALKDLLKAKNNGIKIEHLTSLIERLQ
ncbi:MAG: hypothetical protein A2158_00720 [Chloroflexi bacterium RBG_13_46_14]|nr:MAG: hypothetical protein A2158_00720 [Chloroflexi bacterium RBG_13_46_14]